MENFKILLDNFIYNSFDELDEINVLIDTPDIAFRASINVSPGTAFITYNQQPVGNEITLSEELEKEVLGALKKRYSDFVKQSIMKG